MRDYLLFSEFDVGSRFFLFSVIDFYRCPTTVHVGSRTRLGNSSYTHPNDCQYLRGGWIDELRMNDDPEVKGVLDLMDEVNDNNN